MQLEQDTFFNQLKQHYKDNTTVQPSIKVPIKQLYIKEIHMNDESITTIDIMDLSNDETLILMCSNSTIKCYIHGIKLSLIYRFIIKLEITDDTPYRTIKSMNDKDQVFLHEAQKSTPLPKSETLLVCIITLIHNQVYLFAGGQLGFVYCIPVTNQPHYRILEGHHHVVCGFTYNSQAAFSCSKDGSIIQWDVSKYRSSIVYRDKSAPDAQCLCISTNNNQLLSAHSDGYLRVWDIQFGQMDTWNPKQINHPKLKLQSPFQDIHPHITQIQLLKQTVIAKHLNGLIDHFVLEGNKSLSLYDIEMSDNNYWESIGINYPFIALNSCERLQIHDLINQHQIYESDISHICDGPQIMLRISTRLVMVSSKLKYTIILL